MTIHFIAFDLGNVLCDLDTPGFARALAAAANVPLEGVESAFDSAAHRSMERGESLPDAFRAAICKRLGVALDDATFDRCWNLIPTPRAGADGLVARVKVPHAIWSNTDPIHAKNLMPQMRSLQTARHLHFSFSARTRKPERAYYESGLAALGALPHEVLFIDDREDNRQAAAALGIIVEPALVLTDVEYALVKHALLRDSD